MSSTTRSFLLTAIASLALLALPNHSHSNAKPDNWRQLFNGKDLTGWKHVGPGEDTVEDGLIRTPAAWASSTGPPKKSAIAASRSSTKCAITTTTPAYSSAFPSNHASPGCPSTTATKCRSTTSRKTSKEDEYHVTGTLYSLTKPLARPGKPGPEWNTMVITLDGPHTVVVLNDVKVTDYTEGQPVPARKFDFEPQHGLRPNEGYIGLQNHSDNDIVFFKEVAVQPLH